MDAKKQLLFQKTFFKLIEEDVTTASAGVGAEGTDQFSGDNKYAPGDNRMPVVLGAKRAKGKNKTKVKIPMQRRNAIGM